MNTKYKFTIIASAVALILSAAAFAQQGGTAQEAKAMLDKAVVAVKADKTKGLDMFNNGQGGSLNRDLYVFCATGYLFPRVSDPTPVPKDSFVTKVGDIYCGVGYYK